MPRKTKERVPYTPEIAAEICERLAAGQSLLEICRSPKMPTESTVRGWAIDDHDGFAARYTRARDIGLDHENDEIKTLSDKCRMGDKVERKEIGRICSLCGQDVRWLSRWVHIADKTPLCEGAKAEKVIEEKIVTGDMVERTRLQIDARKWRLSKMAPKKYGDRIQLANDEQNPIGVRLAQVMSLEELTALERRIKDLESGKPGK